MQFVLFATTFITCMVLTIESSHTFKEPGFHFANQNVHEYLKEQAPKLKKICEEKRTSYTWQLPIGDKKALQFEELVHKGKFDLFYQTSWELININGEANFDPFQEKTLNISFQIRKDTKEIFIHSLYPTFPKVSGVDILQFLMSLSYVCDFSLTLKDESDISIPYRLLHGSGYYENLIKGHGVKKLTNQNKIILKKAFYECANHELSKLDSLRRSALIDETLNSCQKKDISVQDCPVHFLWLGNTIHYTLFPKCGLNYKWPDLLPHPELEFHITPTDLTRIFNKSLPRSKPVLYPIVKECTPKVKDYKTLKKDVISLKFFQHAFEFCFPASSFTALSLFETLKGCVTETLNFLWKNECHPKE